MKRVLQVGFGLLPLLCGWALAGCSDDPCSDPDGVTIHSQADWRDFAEASCTRVSGKLVIEGSDLVDLQPAADKLVSIGGALDIYRNAKLERLSFPNLESVGSHLEIFENTALSKLSAPKLTKGIASMRIYANPKLPQCEVDQLSAQQSTYKLVFFSGNAGTCP